MFRGDCANPDSTAFVLLLAHAAVPPHRFVLRLDSPTSAPVADLVGGLLLGVTAPDSPPPRA